MAGRRQFLRATGASVAVAGLAGCLGGGAGGDGGRKIGILGPANLPQGQSMFNSAELAVQEFGEINGEEVEVVTEDTEASASVTQDAYQNLITGEDVDATMGIFRSEALMGGLFDQLPDTQTLHLGTGAATPEATQRVAEDYESFKYFFRVGPTNAVFLGDTMVTFAEQFFDQLGFEDVALYMEDFAWTRLVQSTLEEDLEDAAGVNIVYNERIAGGTDDLSPVFDEIENSGADVAFTAISSGTEPIIQWANQQPDFAFGGINVPSQLPSLWEDTDGACEFLFSQTSAVADAELGEAFGTGGEEQLSTTDYASNYEEEFGGLPIYTGYHTYDAMHLYKAAVEEAGTFDTEEVIPVIEEMSFGGTVGTVEFLPNDSTFPHDLSPDPEKFPGVYFQWQEADGSGTQAPLWPEDIATGEYQQPDWL